MFPIPEKRFVFNSTPCEFDRYATQNIDSWSAPKTVDLTRNLNLSDTVEDGSFSAQVPGLCMKFNPPHSLQLAIGSEDVIILQ